jgi:hypothetical protein
MLAVGAENDEVKFEVLTTLAMKDFIFWSFVIIQKTELCNEVSCGSSVEIISCFEFRLTLKVRNNEP